MSQAPPSVYLRARERCCVVSQPPCRDTKIVSRHRAPVPCTRMQLVVWQRAGPCRRVVSRTHAAPIATQNLCHDTKPHLARTACRVVQALLRVGWPCRTWPCTRCCAQAGHVAPGHARSATLCHDTVCCIVTQHQKWAVAHSSFIFCTFFFSFIFFSLFHLLEDHKKNIIIFSFPNRTS